MPAHEGQGKKVELQLMNTKNVHTIRQRFDVLIAAVDKVSEVLQPPLINVLVAKLNLSDLEIASISMYIKMHCKHTREQFHINEIESKIKAAMNPNVDPWFGRTPIEELDGEWVVIKSNKEKIKISNFVLRPRYTIEVNQGNKYGVFDVYVKNEDKVRQIILTASDLNDLKTFQEQLARQLPDSSAYINGCAQYMGSLQHKLFTLAEFEYNKIGTSIIGLERFEDNGPKYFCTPNGIYDLDGNLSNDIVYMGNEQSNQEELKNLTNLKHDKDKWRNEIAPTFLSNIIRINEKQTMMQILGYIGSIPHDYVIRKVCHVNAFPYLHIVGEPGAGKSTLMTILKQFTGHNDSTPRVFPTAFEMGKLLNSSYNIPVYLDEYGKRWSAEYTDSIHKVLVEAFNKNRWSRGKSDQSSINYKYKNPLIFGGQTNISDPALQMRTISVQLFKSFHYEEAGKKALYHMDILRKMEDKNFWVGYCLWAARHTNEEVADVFSEYKKMVSKTVNDNRLVNIYTIVLLGLHYMKKLADELCVDIGYDKEDVVKLIDVFASNSNAVSDNSNLLFEFLNDVIEYGRAMGNNNIYGNHFGKGLTVMKMETVGDGPGQYGGTVKREACIYGKPLILIKINEIISVINKYKGNKMQYNPKELDTFIETEFRRSMQNPLGEDNLVLAPKQYRTKYGMYTAFSKAVLEYMFGDLDTIRWKE